MNINILVVGPLQTNCYILEKDGKCLIIDPGDNENFIVENIRKKELIPVGILLTHDHPDHNKYATSLKQMYAIDIYDFNNLFEGKKEIDVFSFEVIYTPGHTNTSISFYFKPYNIMFTGDFLFRNSIGRTDFPNSSYEDMLDSINKIKNYDPRINIYPGHGKPSSLEYEFDNNIYLR